MLTTDEAAECAGLSRLRIQQLCKARRIPGARLQGRVWLIPENFEIKPGKRGPALTTKK